MTGSQQVLHTAHRHLGQLVDLLVPRHCAGCGHETTALCSHCLRVLATPPRATIPRYGTVPVVGIGEYGERLKKLIIAHKDAARSDITPVLGRALARAVIGALELHGWLGQPLSLVPVPTRRQSQRKRGGDPLAAAAKAASAVLRTSGINHRLQPCLQVASRGDQVGLGVGGRLRNVRGTHQLTRAVDFGADWVLILDDVCTTGATLAESARVVQRAGAHVVAGAVIALGKGGPRWIPVCGPGDLAGGASSICPPE